MVVSVGCVEVQPKMDTPPATIPNASNGEDRTLLFFCLGDTELTAYRYRSRTVK